MKHRETPNWPDYVARAVALAIAVVGPFALQGVPAFMRVNILMDMRSASLPSLPLPLAS
ncbi:hypothetical protein [Agrobacterium vitis]|uniref:hypothetical protein n=1 Tax=Agrobacterium vitis TaxID=373 RepID=UPI0012E795FA|nr:hypothetical protein [Agrobacterium vitis]MUZ65015.1 hypothetical protein [Agrobacterium vitis]